MDVWRISHSKAPGQLVRRHDIIHYLYMLKQLTDSQEALAKVKSSNRTMIQSPPQNHTNSK